MDHLKPHRSVAQIAKKHRMDVSDIQRQLDMGEPIEHEHTKDHKLAMDIALQHLDEFPDYYTRLKKMEASARKEHKKFKDVKEALDGKSARDPDYSLKDWFNDEWVQTGGKYDGKPCAKQPGQTTKPYCRDPDDRADMSKEERNKRASKKRKEDPNPNRSGKAKMVTQESAGEKDACYKKVKSRYKVWPSAYASGALVKCRKVGAANWGTKSESTNSLGYDWDTPVRERADRYCPKCEKLERRTECKYGPRYWDTFSLPAEIIGSKKDYNITMPHPGNFPEAYDHEYSMARSEISTIIGAAKRLRKKIGKGEGSIEAWVQSKITKAADYLDSAADYVDSGEMKKESVSIEDANGNHYAEFIDIIKPEPLKPSEGIGSRMLDEAGKKCWPGYKKKGTQKLFGKTYNRCVKEGKTFSSFIDEAKKSEMKCNSPKAEPVGDSLTGKSHVVKACEGGKEKLIRFGQRGVKGSPKKEGESKAYASRRNRFQTRHAKNIAKGKMSAAYWANKVKW